METKLIPPSPLSIRIYDSFPALIYGGEVVGQRWKGNFEGGEIKMEIEKEQDAFKDEEKMGVIRRAEG